jgi:hypothetical protein
MAMPHFGMKIFGINNRRQIKVNRNIPQSTLFEIQPVRDAKVEPMAVRARASSLARDPPDGV